MTYCSVCAQPVEWRVPELDDRERAICTGCGVVHYANPKIVVAALVEEAGRVLLCRRAIEPRRGFWTLPGGFLELGESAIEGAARETWEEAGARVRVVAPLLHADILPVAQSYLIYRAVLIDPAVAAGPESLEVGFFEEAAIPWEDLAFTVVRKALELWRDDRADGAPRAHFGRLIQEPHGGWRLVRELVTPLR